MTHKGLWLPAQGEPSVIEWGNGNALEVLQHAVGGSIEYVEFPERWLGMFLNEEGKLVGLPPNYMASSLWVDEYGDTDRIVGDVVLTSIETDDEGHTLGLSEERLFYLGERYGVRADDVA